VKIFIAGLDNETNTFSPIPVGLASFERGMLAHGDATALPANYCSGPLIVWRRLAEAKGFEVAEGLCAVAEPAGLIMGPVYEALRDEILDNLKAAMPVDIVLLALHGACAAEGYDDVEGDILTRVREIVGDAPIGAELDPHCHLTPTMMQAATALVLYKEYPHTDIEARAPELFDILLGAAEKRLNPVMASFDCRMIGLYPTDREPMGALVRQMQAMEREPGMLSMSLAHGFPYGDVVDVGTRVLAISDGDPAKAAEAAERFGREIYARRNELQPNFAKLDDALDRALAGVPGKPYVMAECADNPGGGAPSDNTFVLRRLLERGIKDAAIGMFWDPVALGFCQEAGVGATLELRLGGKCGVASGEPLDVKATVRALAQNHSQRFGPEDSPIEMLCGAAAWLTIDGVDVVVNNLRVQVVHPDCMTRLGIDVESKRVIVVKSVNHFAAAFAPIAREIIHLATPGALATDARDIAYTKRAGPFWPKTADPFAA
jgi:microcystin degradation protein MlrC